MSLKAVKHVMWADLALSPDHWCVFAPATWPQGVRSFWVHRPNSKRQLEKETLGCVEGGEEFPWWPVGLHHTKASVVFFSNYSLKQKLRASMNPYILDRRGVHLFEEVKSFVTLVCHLIPRLFWLYGQEQTGGSVVRLAVEGKLTEPTHSLTFL